MVNKERVKELSAKIKEEIISIRRHLHAHPELSFQEIETAKFISSKLSAWNIEHQTGIGGNGIVALIKGRNPGKKTIALRADMDALPITEKNEVEYKSQHNGIMHACGHDVHSASLLGTAKILNDLKNEFEGTIKLIFQPAEEKLPGGASIMINDGVLENPKPDVIIAQHVFTPLHVGTAGFRPGKYMASADEIYITVKGKGGHAADPALVINPIFIAARLLSELEELMQQLSTSEIPTVLNFGKVIGAGATNVIPDEVTIDGTLRTLDEAWRETVHHNLKELIQNFSEKDKTIVLLRMDKGYPCLINDKVITSEARSFAEDYLGKENVKDLDIRMASEDFAFFSQAIPACFYRIGTGNPEKNITSGVHTPVFNIDEDALEISTGLMAWIALNLLLN
ncbi:MAG: amidohydrolase [Chitinophagales bacterium]|nr:amidohydrolase [Chitinophagales bacterium]